MTTITRTAFHDIQEEIKDATTEYKDRSDLQAISNNCSSSGCFNDYEKRMIKSMCKEGIQILGEQGY